MENWSDVTVQLLSRHWVMENDEGVDTEVVPKGSPGVVGNQPVLAPGKRGLVVRGIRYKVGQSRKVQRQHTGEKFGREGVGSRQCYELLPSYRCDKPCARQITGD